MKIALVRAAVQASPGRAILHKLRAKLTERAPTPHDSLPARTWRGIDPLVRTTLVMIASADQGDPRTLALQPWESFSVTDRAALAAVAKVFHTSLREVAALW